MLIPALAVTGALALALYSATRAALSFERKGLVPLAGWATVATASWAGALAASTAFV